MGPPPLWHFLQSQIFWDLPKPTKSFEGQTVIVTGSNTGIGFECAKHIVKLQAAKVILAVRSLDRGNKAAAAIAQATGCHEGVIEVRELDLASYGSIQRFAAAINAPDGLDRLDVMIGNAGILTQVAELAEDDERIIKVNVLGTYLLNFLVLPKLRETAEKYNKTVVMTMTGSWMHWMTDFPERNADDVFEALADIEHARMKNHERYCTSKLIQFLLYQEFVKHLTQPKQGRIITSITNPGGVATGILRDKQSWLEEKLLAIQSKVMLRTAEQGARTLVHAAEGDAETDGQYLCDCKPAPPELVSGFVKSEEGAQAGERTWSQMLQRLEVVEPFIQEKI